jgi:hypothetical protein
MKNPFINIRISLKLVLISVFYLLPVGALAFLMIKGINANIHFARWETYGNEYQRKSNFCKYICYNFTEWFIYIQYHFEANHEWYWWGYNPTRFGCKL